MAYPHRRVLGGRWMTAGLPRKIPSHPIGLSAALVNGRTRRQQAHQERGMMRPFLAALLIVALNVRLHADDSVPSPKPQAPIPSLHDRIDQLVESAAIGPLAPLCSDADFVRRVYLDLTGVIPT